MKKWIQIKFPRLERSQWRIYSRVVLIQSFLILLLVIFSGIGIRYYFKSHLLDVIPSPQLEHIFRSYDTAFSFFLIGMTLLLVVFASILGRKLVFPIGRMLIKTQNVLNRESPSQKNEPDYEMKGLEYESDEAWSDLESSIEKIKRDLEAKIESLRLEREEQAILMSAISDAILAIDREGTPLFYNSRLALMFGSKEMTRNRRIWELFRDPEILSGFHDALKEGKSNSLKAIPLEQPSGKRFFSVAISPLKKSNETIYGAVGIFHDVTDLKRAEQIRIDFVANVSHELRTPLTAIKGYTDTLAQDCREGKPASPEFLEIITRNTDRLMNLINDLLDLSSLDSTDILHKALLSTEEITNRVTQQMKGSFESKKQILTIENRASTVVADPKRLEQVLVNLLDNAHKYTPSGGKIDIEWQTENTTDTLLKVKDSGPGIPPEHLNRLFERFYRVDKARSRELGGTGLGLAIVKHIMQRHDGSIQVESTPGKGALFTCRFPG